METFVSILMLAGIALVAGAVVLFRKGRRQQALLMAAAGLIMFANVAIWLIPTDDGRSLVNPES